jgi:hypothetical protein
MKIIVNGSANEVDASRMSYDDVIRIAFNGRPVGHPSVTYRNASGPADGILMPGADIGVREGTVFNVCHTGNA